MFEEAFLTMDIPRPSQARARRRKNILLSLSGLGLLLLLTLGLSRLRPAAPSVDRAALWIDTVKRGPMLRQVRGLGTLVPEEIRWIPATTDARVESILIHPGARVKPESVLLELSNPEVDLQLLDAESQLRAALAQYTELKVRLESQRLDQEAVAARSEAEYHQAKLHADADEQLAKEGLIASLSLKLSEVTAEELDHRAQIEQKRLEISSQSMAAQLAVQEAAVDQRRAMTHLRRSQKESFRVRAGLEGVLQVVPVEVGQRVAPGTNLARVAQPSKLKAVIKIGETQAKDIQLGQRAEVDTRNGIIAGRVARIDPSVQNGTVTIDVEFGGPLPPGARPDLTVDGTVELEHLDSVLHVGRPAQAQSGAIGLFRLDEGGRGASRVKVRLGKTSVSSVEILDGLREGDQVILSDTSRWDQFDRIRLN
jgi:HlyD family secretion protein